MHLSINELCVLVIIVLSFCFGYLKAKNEKKYSTIKHDIVKTPTPYDEDNADAYYK